MTDRIKYFVFGLAAGIAFAGCTVNAVDTDTPDEPVEVVSPAGERLTFKVDFDGPKTKSAERKTRTFTFEGDDGMSVECVAEPVDDGFVPSTRVSLTNFTDRLTLYAYRANSSGSNFTFELSDELVYDPGTDSWSTSGYYSLPTGTPQAFIVCSDLENDDPIGFEDEDIFGDGFSIFIGSNSSDPLMGVAYVSSYSSSSAINVTVHHLSSAVGFKFSGTGPSGAVISRVELRNYFCYCTFYPGIDGDVFVESETDSSVDTDTSYRNVNHTIVSGTPAWLVGGESFSGDWFICAPFDYDETINNPAYIRVILSYQGSDYTLDSHLDEMSFDPGYVYTFNLSFSSSSFPVDGPYITLSRFSDVLDCNPATVTVPFTSNITDASTWGIATNTGVITGGSVTRPATSGGTGNFTYSIPANLYGTSRTDETRVYFDGPSGTPKDFVTSQWLNVTQSGTSVQMGPDYSSHFPATGNTASGTGETVTAYASSTYHGENINVYSSQGWARAVRVGGDSYQNRFNIVFDANDTGADRSVVFTVKGSQSGVSPYNVSRTYTYTQPSGYWYDHILVVDPSSITIGVGESLSNVKAKLYTDTYAGVYPDRSNRTHLDTTGELVNCSWTMSNTSVASVSPTSGASSVTVTGLQAGSSNLRARYVSGGIDVYADVNVSVVSDETCYRLQMDNSVVNIYVGDSASLPMHLYDDTYRNGSIFYWDPSGILATPSQYDWSCYDSSWNNLGSEPGLVLTSAGNVQGRVSGTYHVFAQCKSPTPGYRDSSNNLVNADCQVNVLERTSTFYGLYLSAVSWPHSPVDGHIYPGEYVDLAVSLRHRTASYQWNSASSSFTWVYSSWVNDNVSIPASQCQWYVDGVAYSSNSYVSVNTSSGRVTGLRKTGTGGVNISVVYTGSAYSNDSGSISSNSVNVVVDREAGGHD